MNIPLMMSVAEFAQLHRISETTVRDCIRGESTTYPPLQCKRVGSSRKSRIYITAEQAAEWRAALPDA